MTHIGIIMDGNRRWATERGLQSWKGHEAGMENVLKLAEWMEELQVKEATLYTFSVQNFKRDQQEVKYLMKLFHKLFDKIIADERIMKRVRINFIGRLWMFEQDVQDKQQELMELTKKNSEFIVNFAMGYGGREEIIDAVKILAQEVKSGDLEIKDIDNETFSEYLYLQSEPDLVIRTSGEIRTSNFLIWQSWYSEWFFLEKYWPEFSKDDLAEVLEKYSNRKRRFGK